MTTAESITLAASVAAAVFAGPTLWLTYLGYRRARERSDVKWQVERVEEGVFDVVNVGHDPAFKVNVELWTTTELESATAKKVTREDHLRIRLPRRAVGEIEAIELPSTMFEDFPDDPPVLNPLLGSASRKIKADWERGKKLKDETMKRHAELERMEKESQVQVRVVWRSKRGAWSEHTEQTG